MKFRDVTEDEIFSRRIVPHKLKNGTYTLHELIMLKETTHTVGGLHLVNKTLRRVWPPIKQANGQGERWSTRKEAIEAIGKTAVRRGLC